MDTPSTYSSTDHANGTVPSDSRARTQALAKNISDNLAETYKKTSQSVIDHPYFTAGIVAGIGLAIGGVVAYRARQKQAFFDRMMRWF